MLTSIHQRKTIQSEFTRIARRAKPPRLRSMREFVEQEMVIPDGPYQGRKFNCDRQPYSRLWFDAIDKGNWNRFFATGPTQSGKTLSCFVSPLMYHLFEMNETVICGLPTHEMAKDKWECDIRPAIEASRYRELLPTKGKGSQGGTPTMIVFGNGAKLRFMSGGGGDKSRAGFTSRVIVLTEIDGFDEQGESSREADKITQIEERSRAFGSRKRIYGECTVSIEDGRIWQEYSNGTHSSILLHCQHCGSWVTPERDHLKGYGECESDVEAEGRSAFHCPECDAKWTEEDRRKANEAARLIHRGQELTPEGEIVGEPAATQTLGFRWSAVNNLFLKAGEYGVDEWKAVRDEDEQNAEKKMRQFVWAIPYEPPIKEFSKLNMESITRRTSGFYRRQFPENTIAVSMGIDVGKWLLWYVTIAWITPVDGLIVDYGAKDVPSAHMEEQRAIVLTLNMIRDEIVASYDHQPGAVYVDSGYMNDAVYEFCLSQGLPYWACKGFGQGEKGRKYQTPSDSKKVEFVGNHYHGARQDHSNIILVDTDSDHWKSVAQHGFTVPVGEDGSGSLMLYEAKWQEHVSFAKHLTAEQKVQKFEEGPKGTRVYWDQKRDNNHLLDATAMACAAGDLSVQIAMYDPAPQKPTQRSGGFVSRRLGRR